MQEEVQTVQKSDEAHRVIRSVAKRVQVFDEGGETMEHFPDCVEAFESYEKMKKKFEEKFPLYCRSCHGWSGKVIRYDPSPPGISLAPGYMEDFELCPDCTEKGLCPRCTAALVEDAGEYSDPFRCPVCGWTDNPDKESVEKCSGLPEQPECWCDYRRTHGTDETP